MAAARDEAREVLLAGRNQEFLEMGGPLRTLSPKVLGLGFRMTFLGPYLGPKPWGCVGTKIAKDICEEFSSHQVHYHYFGFGSRFWI